jgi:hypothetical protein
MLKFSCSDSKPENVVPPQTLSGLRPPSIPSPQGASKGSITPEAGGKGWSNLEFMCRKRRNGGGAFPSFRFAGATVASHMPVRCWWYSDAAFPLGNISYKGFKFNCALHITLCGPLEARTRKMTLYACPRFPDLGILCVYANIGQHNESPSN